jgi:AraC-like DNA-binding protein
LSSPILLERFSTAALPERDRYEAWRSRDWPSVVPLYETRPTEPFQCTSDRLQLGSTLVHYVSISAQQWLRTCAQVRSFDPDHLAFAVTLDGTAKGVCDARQFATGPGDVHLADLSRSSVHASGASRTIYVVIPRAAAAAAGLQSDKHHGLVLHAPLGGLLASHLLNIRDAVGGLTVSDGEKVGTGVLDLLSLAVRGSEAAELPANREFDVARRLIEQQLDQEGFSINKLCQELGMSRSKLHRLFEDSGGVQAFVRRRRLQAVRAELANPGSGMPIQLLAYKFGFSDAAHLSRSFRAEFGITPRDYRERARAPSRNTSPTLGQAEDS